MRTMINPDTALQLVLEHARSSDPVRRSIYEAIGCALAQPIISDRDYPPFNRAMMDGFAVAVSDAGKTIEVCGEVAAGASTDAEVRPGIAIEIMTGAPCPAGTEAVVPKEDAIRSEHRVTLPTTIKPGQNIALAGAECPSGTMVLRPGDVITPLALASIVTFGIEHVLVYPKPTLAIITTGDELVEPAVSPGPSQIRNSNAPMLATLAQSMGITPTVVAHARDTVAELLSTLQQANHCDFVVLTGAVSEGRYDSVPDALARFEATPVFHKVTQRPGKPLYFATRGEQLIFGLPGNPLSCHLGFHRYVAPAARVFMHRPPDPLRSAGRLTEAFVMKGPRTVFQLARADDANGEWQVRPLLGKGSADMYSASTANCVLRFEPESGTTPAGAAVSFEWLLGAP